MSTRPVISTASWAKAGKASSKATIRLRNGTDYDIALLAVNFIYDTDSTRWEQTGIRSGEDRSVNYKIVGKQCTTMKGLGGASVRALRCQIVGMSQKECAKLLRLK